MTATTLIRLLGGRYDGDQGDIGALPRIVWALPCDEEGSCADGHCVETGGVHWIVDPGVALVALEAISLGWEPYLPSHFEHDAWIYTHATLDLPTPSPSAWEAQRRRALERPRHRRRGGIPILSWREHPGASAGRPEAGDA